MAPVALFMAEQLCHLLMSAPSLQAWMLWYLVSAATALCGQPMTDDEWNRGGPLKPAQPHVPEPHPEQQSEEESVQGPAASCTRGREESEDTELADGTPSTPQQPKRRAAPSARRYGASKAPTGSQARQPHSEHA